MYIDHSVAVRMQWAKTYTHAAHWCEEVLILREEMSHVTASFRYKAAKWHSYVSEGNGGDARFHDGWNAYAWEHCTLYEGLLAKFHARWMPVLVQATAELQSAWDCAGLTEALSASLSPIPLPPSNVDAEDVIVFDEYDDVIGDDDD